MALSDMSAYHQAAGSSKDQSNERDSIKAIPTVRFKSEKNETSNSGS